MSGKEIIHLMRKELILEWRQKHALGGILLYLVSTIFICYLAFSGVMTTQTWNALFWIIIAFASFNLVLKSFADENQGRKLYLYTLAAPGSVLFSKIIVNTLILCALGFLGYLFFNLFMGSMAANQKAFLALLPVGVAGFASILTMVSAIAGQTKNSFTLMTILGFPLILPMLLLLIRASEAAINGMPFVTIRADVAVVLMLVALALVLSYVLFPYLWKE